MLAALQGAADPRWAGVVVGGLDEQSARVRGAGLGDCALAALVAAGVFGCDEAEVGAERGRAEEALEVADLGADAERRQRVEAVQAAQPRDDRRPGRVGGELGDGTIERVAAGEQDVVGVQVVGEETVRPSVCEAE